MKIEKLNFSVRTYNILKRAGFHTVEQLQQLTDDELVCIRNLGRNSLGEIHEKLEQYGMTKADFIRSMTDEELENGIRAIARRYEPWCDHHCKLVEFDQFKNDAGSNAFVMYPLSARVKDNCNVCLAKWLKQPYKENTDGSN